MTGHARLVRALPVPTGERVLDVLDDLAAALAGRGDALLPVPAGDPGRAGRLAAAAGAGAPLAAGEDDPDDPTAFVVATSGSGGAPKAALLPAGALRASAAATSLRLDGAASPPAAWLLALPTEHVAGLQVLLRALAAGGMPTVLDTGKAFTPAGFVEATGRMPGGRRFVSLVPTQLHRILLDDEAAAALAGFDAVLVGGSATSADLLDRAAAAGIRVVTTYGMTETCGGCVYDGRALDGVDISVDTGVDTGVGGGGDPPAAEAGDRPGRVRVSGAVVARGYRGLPRHPDFRRSSTPDGERRTFLTADRGVLRGGALTILGRIDDVLVTGGRKVDPLAIERALAAAPGVAEIVVVGVPHPEWGDVVTAVVTRHGDAVPDLETMRALAAAALGSAAAPRHLLVVPELPAIGPGKPDRSAIRDLAAHALTADW